MLGKKVALIFGAALLGGFALIMAFAIYDKSQRAVLERVEEPTAVGDNAWFHPPEKFDSSAVFATYEGQPLYPTGADRYDLRDSKMIKVGMDDSKSFWIYKSLERGGKEGDYFF